MVVGRSNIVGLPLALLALHRDATVTVCHVQTPQGGNDGGGGGGGGEYEFEEYGPGIVGGIREGASGRALPDEEGSTRLATACRMADILITAAGSPGLVKGHWIKPGAVVVDVGFNVVEVPGDEGDAAAAASPPPLPASTQQRQRQRTRTRISGDVSFEEARRVASQITPVPGGVGPMTVAMLMQNTLSSFVRRMCAQEGR